MPPFLFCARHLAPAAREKVVGWYSSGPKLKEADLDINELMGRFCEADPVLVICEVAPKEIGLPFTAYVAVDEVKEVSRYAAADRLLPRAHGR